MHHITEKIRKIHRFWTYLDETLLARCFFFEDICPKTFETLAKEEDDSGEGLTVVMVAHRLSTLRNCDQIFELRDGKIVASGRFEDLLESSGSFREMARSSTETG